MRIIRKTTSELSDEEITRLSEVINEALYDRKEGVDSVKRMYFSYEGNNFISYGNSSTGILQSRHLDKVYSAHITVGALDEQIRRKGVFFDMIDKCIEFAESEGMDFVCLTVGNPYVMSIFHGKGFKLPSEMNEERPKLLEKAKEVLKEETRSDLGISELFIIAKERFNYPPLAKLDEAYDTAVMNYVSRFMRPNDRLFMIKELI